VPSNATGERRVLCVRAIGGAARDVVVLLHAGDDAALRMGVSNVTAEVCLCAHTVARLLTHIADLLAVDDVGKSRTLRAQ
jgi:hypothetical protein